MFRSDPQHLSHHQPPLITFSAWYLHFAKLTTTIHSPTKCSFSKLQGSCSFVPVFFVASMLRKGGGGGAVTTQSEWESGWVSERAKKTTFERTIAYFARLAVNAHKALFQIPDQIVSSDQVTCLERPASLQTQIGCTVHMTPSPIPK